MGKNLLKKRNGGRVLLIVGLLIAVIVFSLWRVITGPSSIVTTHQMPVQPQDSVTQSNSAATPAQPEDLFRTDGMLSFHGKAGKVKKQIAIEVVTTEGGQRLGLMYRKSMTADQGMLFAFEQEEPRSFWMKNTYISLDIMFLSAAKHVITIRDNTTPLSEASVASTGPAKYVVEIEAGFAKKFGVQVGDSVSWELF